MGICCGGGYEGVAYAGGCWSDILETSGRCTRSREGSLELHVSDVFIRLIDVDKTEFLTEISRAERSSTVRGFRAVFTTYIYHICSTSKMTLYIHTSYIFTESKPNGSARDKRKFGEHRLKWSIFGQE